MGAPKIHGASLGNRRSSEYAAWVAMRMRCNNPKNKRYEDYGGRGITFCQRWEDFTAFLDDLGRKPTKDHSLDRFDNDGNYEPGNCRWATRVEQCRNQRSNRLLTVGSITLTVAEWAVITGVNYNTISSRLHDGWDDELAVTAPVQAQYSRGPVGKKISQVSFPR